MRLGEFEFYTAGDQTDNDWKSKPAVEESIIDSGAIPGGHDVDVLKVSHHGSDTSTSHDFVAALDPEVAVISTKFTRSDKLPKKIALKQLQENRCCVLITGDGRNPDTGDPDDPDTRDFTDASTPDDDSFTVDSEAVFNNQGNVTILVSVDGGRYTVIGDSFAKTFSAVDGDNAR